MAKLKKDNRRLSWSELELNIQRRAFKKDKNFSLQGKWKKYVRDQKGFEIYAVDGKWVRNNLCGYFGHGGHGFVHEFIPLREIWISTHHYCEGNLRSEECGCTTRYKNQRVSREYFDSTAIHEIEEFMKMMAGKRYWQAHQIALQKEREAGLLKDILGDL